MRKRGLLAMIILTGFFSNTLGQGKMVRQKIEENISLKVPSSFIPMSENDMWQRVSSYRKSLALFTDMDRLVELGINRSYSVWREGDYQVMFDVYKSSIQELFDEVEFLREDIVRIKRKTFVVFEFISRISRDEGSSVPIIKYTYVQYTLYEGQTLVFNFSCPEHQREKWQPVANQIMNSVVIK